jgi:hypothetical protein
VVTNELPRRAVHPFYTRLNQILEQHDVDGYAEDSASDSTRRTADPDANAAQRLDARGLRELRQEINVRPKMFPR